MKKLVIIGAGDFGREVAHLVERINKREFEWDLLGFVDDNLEISNRVIDNYPVMGDIEWLESYKEEIYVVCAIGNGKVREKIISNLTNNNIKYATLIDPYANVFRDSVIGEGCIICAGNIISINNSIGKHVIINLNCTLGHDDQIASFCTINPGVNISGKVCISKCTDLGTGTKVIQGIKIGERVVSGAGAVIIRDIAADSLVVGCPAKEIKKAKAEN